MEIIATIDNELEFNLDYLTWWSFEINNCLDEYSLRELEDFYYNKIHEDENIQLLIKQRREELYNPLHRARSGNTLSQREINKAVEMAVKSDRT